MVIYTGQFQCIIDYYNLFSSILLITKEINLQIDSVINFHVCISTIPKVLMKLTS